MSSPTPSGADPFDDIMEEYERLKERGPVDVEALLSRCPEALRADVRLAIELAGPGRPPRREGGEGPGPGPFGKYRQMEKIADGGMGVVYRAWEALPERYVAVKVLRAGTHDTPEARARFLGEARNVCGLVHPNIVQVYDVGFCQGHPYFSMELAAGTLAAPTPAPRPPREVARLLALVARAVRHAHEKGVLHRDLKPANILLMADGTPKVADFGLSRRVGPAPPPAPAGPGETVSLPLDGQTGAGAVIGTLEYMAPEQARGEAVGPAADVYGLGAVLYEMLTGRPPHRGSGMLDTLARARHEDPVSPRAVNPAADPHLSALCLACLRRAPEDRPTMPDVAEDLEKIQAGRGSGFLPDVWDWLRYAWGREPPRAEYAWWKLPVIACISIACHGGAAFAMASDRPLAWVWAAWAADIAAIGLLNWLATLIWFHKVPPEQHLASMCSVAHTLAVAAVMLGTAPWGPWAPARDALPAYVGLTAVSGITFFFLGLAFWGRLMAPGLLLFVLAAVIRVTGDYAPLLHAGANAVILCWWAWVTSRRFLPPEARP